MGIGYSLLYIKFGFVSHKKVPIRRHLTLDPRGNGMTLFVRAPEGLEIVGPPDIRGLGRGGEGVASGWLLGTFRP